MILSRSKNNILRLTSWKLVGQLLIIALLILSFIFSTFIFFSKCEKTNTGWSCEFLINPLANIYGNNCETQGGRWLTHESVWGGSVYGDCDFPYSDAGKECLNSKECEGGCVAKMNYDWPLENEISCVNCKGECAKYISGGWWIELNDNKIEYHTGAVE